SFVFFFQAEDGIRDFHVTGVQTCALPIYAGGLRQLEQANHYSSGPSLRELLDEPPPSVAVLRPWEQSIAHAPAHEGTRLSLQREIGRASCRERGECAWGGGAVTRRGVTKG